MEKECLPSKIVTGMKEVLKMGNSMEWGNIFLVMLMSMKENFNKDKYQEKGFNITEIMFNIEVRLNKVKKMERVLKHIQMDQNMKVTI